MNGFCHYLNRLPARLERACLAALCAQPRHPHEFPEAAVRTLERLGLVQPHLGGWRPTWLGSGVHNWHRQLKASQFLGLSSPAEPRPGENGEELGTACYDFRELHFRPRRCWCGRPASVHSGCAPTIAEEFLSWHESFKDGPAQHRQERILAIVLRLSSSQRLVLPQVRDYPGIKLAGLVGGLAGLVGTARVKEAVQDLLRLRLLLEGPGLLLSWRGRGVACYLAELELARSFGLQLTSPGPGENGFDPLPKPCTQFRGLLTRPSSCWCGWRVDQHSKL
ncbi:hypothetical protein JST97_18995 [bacterium]|nr:hypothetical protein [bacterium]